MPVPWPVTDVEVREHVTSQSWLMRCHGMSAGVFKVKSSPTKKESSIKEKAPFVPILLLLSDIMWGSEGLSSCSHFVTMRRKARKYQETLTQHFDIAESQN